MYNKPIGKVVYSECIAFKDQRSLRWSQLESLGTDSTQNFTSVFDLREIPINVLSVANKAYPYWLGVQFVCFNPYWFSRLLQTTDAAGTTAYACSAFWCRREVFDWTQKCDILWLSNVKFAIDNVKWLFKTKYNTNDFILLSLLFIL